MNRTVIWCIVVVIASFAVMEAKASYFDGVSRRISGIFGVSSPITVENCVDADPIADPSDKTRYYQCFYVNEQWYIVSFECPAEGYFDLESKSCIADSD